MDFKNAHIQSCLEADSSVFNMLTVKEKISLQQNHNYAHYRKGEIIFQEGEKPAGLLCLADGKVKVIKEGVGGREQIIRMIRPYGFIGYRALLADEKYTASAVAIEDCTVCVLDKDNLFKVLKKNSELSMRIMRQMASELGFSNTRTVSLTQKHIRGRLAESLLFLIETYGFESDGSTIRVYLSREDLANLSNMTTSNAIRTLSTFANENVIDLNGRKIRILDINKLSRISSLG